MYRLGRRRAADFTALLQMIAEAFPRAAVIVVICDNDSIHARKVTAHLEKRPRLELLYGARYSPHDNPDLGGAEELRGEHRRELARPPAADSRLLPQPLTGSDAGYRRALDQPLAAAGLRAELLECG